MPKILAWCIDTKYTSQKVYKFNDSTVNVIPLPNTNWMLYYKVLQCTMLQTYGMSHSSRDARNIIPDVVRKSCLLSKLLTSSTNQFSKIIDIYPLWIYVRVVPRKWKIIPVLYWTTWSNEYYTEFIVFFLCKEKKNDYIIICWDTFLRWLCFMHDNR